VGEFKRGVHKVHSGGSCRIVSERKKRKMNSLGGCKNLFSEGVYEDPRVGLSQLATATALVVHPVL